MSVSRRFGFPLFLQLAVVGSLAACGGSDDKGDDDSAGGGGTDVGGASASDSLRVVFSPMYSAFIPGHDCKIPVIVNGKSGADVTFTADDPSIVDITRSAEGATLTTKKAGTTMIRAKAGDETGSAKLTVTGYTAEEWEAGNKRYNNGNALTLPNFDGGIPMGVPTGGAIPMISPDLACANCHGEASVIGDVFGADIEHTPAQTGGYSEAELIGIFTMGMKPAGVGFRTGIPSFIWQMIHKWNVTEEEKKGIIAYLRSITPKGQGMFQIPAGLLEAGVPRVPTGGGDAGM